MRKEGAGCCDSLLSQIVWLVYYLTDTHIHHDCVLFKDFKSLLNNCTGCHARLCHLHTTAPSRFFLYIMNTLMCVSNTDSGHGAEVGCVTELLMWFFCVCVVVLE